MNHRVFALALAAALASLLSQGAMAQGLRPSGALAGNGLSRPAPASVPSVALPAAPWPLPAVPGDPDLLFVALYNVAANAAKYSEAEDLIEVRGSEQAGSVVLEIADTGRGIPPADQPVVFEDLARGANARDRPGSGLGLALARTIVGRHGGDITLVSREGQGTRVRVSLPAHESHA